MKIYNTFSNTLSTFLEFLSFEIDNAISCEFCKINIAVDSNYIYKFFFLKSMGNTESTMNSILVNEVDKPKKPANEEFVESVMKNENLEQVNRSNDKLKKSATAEVGENLDLDLDQVHRSTDKLAHPAAERAKAPKRRLPTNISMICYSCIHISYYFDFRLETLM